MHNPLSLVGSFRAVHTVFLDDIVQSAQSYKIISRDVHSLIR